MNEAELLTKEKETQIQIPSLPFGFSLAKQMIELRLGLGFPYCKSHLLQNKNSKGFNLYAYDKVNYAACSINPKRQATPSKPNVIVKKENIKQTGKREHHLWKKRDSAGSGQKALNLVRIVSALPSEKEAVYGALDKWIAWETEFPLIAAAKALKILQKRNQWLRVIQVGKWMLSKGQGLTMGTYDTLLLAFDMDKRVDEAESFWNMIVHTHTRSVSKRLFSRIIALYDHHQMTEKIIEVFADMEELGVKPDEDTVRRVSHAFQKLGDEDKQKLVLKKYLNKWKYIHFNGERVKVPQVREKKGIVLHCTWGCDYCLGPPAYKEYGVITRSV